jgi:hypothetical protein
LLPELTVLLQKTTDSGLRGWELAGQNTHKQSLGTVEWDSEKKKKENKNMPEKSHTNSKWDGLTTWAVRAGWLGYVHWPPSGCCEAMASRHQPSLQEAEKKAQPSGPFHFFYIYLVALILRFGVQRKTQ